MLAVMGVYLWAYWDVNAIQFCIHALALNRGPFGLSSESVGREMNGFWNLSSFDMLSSRTTVASIPSSPHVLLCSSPEWFEIWTHSTFSAPDVEESISVISVWYADQTLRFCIPWGFSKNDIDVRYNDPHYEAKGRQGIRMTKVCSKLNHLVQPTKPLEYRYTSMKGERR